MAIALLSLAGLFMPLQSLFSRWAVPARRLRLAAPSAAGQAAAAVPRPMPSPRATPCVRVLRLVEGEASERGARLVVSGRIDDVCAELERLAAAEEARPPC